MAKKQVSFAELMALPYELQKILQEGDVLLFLFSNKPSVQVGVEGDKIAIDHLCQLLERFINIANPKIKKIWARDVPIGGVRHLFLTKREELHQLLRTIPLDARKHVHRVLGRYFGYPECCVKAYIKDRNNVSSWNSFIRYKRQQLKLKIRRDKFNLSSMGDGVICREVGFIPCHPNCGEANKILRKLKRIRKKLNYHQKVERICEQ